MEVLKPGIDKFIIGQQEAARRGDMLRNRYRRSRLTRVKRRDNALIMKGPTGVGNRDCKKTGCRRRSVIKSGDKIYRSGLVGRM